MKLKDIASVINPAIPYIIILDKSDRLIYEFYNRITEISEDVSNTEVMQITAINYNDVPSLAIKILY